MSNSLSYIKGLSLKYVALLGFYLLIYQGEFLFSFVRPEIQEIIACYDRGDYEQSKKEVETAVPLNPEEQAIVYYYKAMLSNDADYTKTQLLLLTGLTPQNRYAQKALFDVGQIYLLDREYDMALDCFNKITEPDFDDKQFWLATTYFQKGDYANTVASANQYIRITSSTNKIEGAYYLLADAYINLSQYNNAISSLKKLLSKPDLLESEQYLRYRCGYAAEMLDNRLEAHSQYKQGYELNRFSQLAYQIEERLFEMRKKYGSSIDLGFLYPYSAESLPDIVLAELNNPGNNNCESNQDSTQVIKSPIPNEVDINKQEGFYLQAGRFSNQNNAIKLCNSILNLKLNAQYYKSTQYSDISWVVIVGPYQTELDAVNAKTLLRENDIDSFIIQR